MPESGYARTHPYYDDKLETWKFNADHFEGGRTLVESDDYQYLIRFRVEESNSFLPRKKRAMGLYDNLMRRAVNVYQSQLYRVKPNRSEVSDTLDYAKRNADLYGTNADDFFAKSTQNTQIISSHGVLIDSPRVNAAGEAISNAQRQRDGLRPWFESVDRSRIKDWGVEEEDVARRGELNFLKIEDKVVRGRTATEDGTAGLRWRIYERDGITIVTQYGDEEPVKVEIENALGEVPFVMFYDDFIRPMQARTIFDDIALAANSLWNMTSAADEAYYHSSFAILFLFTEMDIATIDIGEVRAMRLKPSDRAEYVVPEPTVFEVFEKRQRQVVERVADLIFARSSRQMPTAQVESAEKKTIDRQELIALLEEKAGNFEQSESKAWKILGMIEGMSEDEAESQKVTYNRSFQVEEREAEEWERLTSEGIMSKAEWYMALHPSVTNEDKAWEAIADNLEKNREMGTAQNQMRNLLAQAIGEGDTPPGQEDGASPPPPTPPRTEDGEDVDTQAA